MDQQPPKVSYIRKAIARTRERALAYVRILAVGVGALILVNGAAVAATLVISSVTSGLPLGPKTLITIIQILLALPLFLFDIYLALWMQLSLAQAVIQPIQEHYRTTIVSVRPFVRDYLTFYFKLMLFLLFLIPLDIVARRFLFIPIVSMLWTAWVLFSVFVFLEKRKKGLANLWTARSIYNQRFVGFTWRIVLTYIGVVIAFAIILAPVLFLLRYVSSSTFPILIIGVVLFMLLQLLVTVFFMSYEYELYASVTEPAVVRTPKEWLWIGLAGIVLFVVVSLLFPRDLSKQTGNSRTPGNRLESALQKGTFRGDFESKQAPRVREAAQLGFNYRLEERDEPVDCRRQATDTGEMYVCEKHVWTLYALPGVFDVETATIYDTFIRNGWTLSERDTGIYYDRASALAYLSSIWNGGQKMEGERLVFEKDGLFANAAIVSANASKLMSKPAVYVTCINYDPCKIMKKYMNKHQLFLMVEVYIEATDPPLPSPTRRPTVTPTPFILPSPSPTRPVFITPPPRTTSTPTPTPTDPPVELTL